MKFLPDNTPKGKFNPLTKGRTAKIAIISSVSLCS
jgi:hypothetical protein